ncbi:rod shape-determining protein MreD [[Haemophilus] felis]|uniref:Rod shape-determining protein MreD n=1 Tax=[Haemophilus] felis TaxID=123822 RepID=A0A1T0BD05_9PAST|nr:rod shape-determining protein MreD [[Haemophilus] felis]NBI40056.1 rod shape-determining protein MreD [[Haemophilus] felis]NBI41986.1 rod shape-determining protein MreD [[Haemophilus] felis]OOS07661.1 rod shape-determining protein MreD [[Haemophilus] felis]
MKQHFLIQWLTVLSTFIIALVLEISPWATHFQYFKPSWLVLVLLYWVLALPNKVSIGFAFVFGVIWDLVLGSVLGTHALVLSVFAYIIALNHLILRNLSLLQQSLLVIIFVAAIRLGIFLLEFFLHDAIFHRQEFYTALVSALLWPWVFLLLRKIRRQVGLS